MSGPGQMLPQAGPLTAWPDGTSEQGRTLLEAAMSGLVTGPVDEAVARLLVDEFDAPVAAVVASWLRRAFEAGLTTGRAETVDELPAVAAARAEAEVYGRVIDEIVTAAADFDDDVAGDVAADEDGAGARAALLALLARIERATALLSGGRLS